MSVPTAIEVDELKPDSSDCAVTNPFATDTEADTPDNNAGVVSAPIATDVDTDVPDISDLAVNFAIATDVDTDVPDKYAIVAPMRGGVSRCGTGNERPNLAITSYSLS
jgi:hypothetical protein